VADLSASTGTSLRACRTSGRHFLGLERDKRIFDELLRPLMKVEK
jgi:DNA modification methylase